MRRCLTIYARSGPGEGEQLVIIESAPVPRIPVDMSLVELCLEDERHARDLVDGPDLSVGAKPARCCTRSLHRPPNLATARPLNPQTHP